MFDFTMTGSGIIIAVIILKFVELSVAATNGHPITQHVNVYHFTNHRWETKVFLNASLSRQSCDSLPELSCEFAYSEQFADLERLRKQREEDNNRTGVTPITVGLYNVHQWENRHRKWHRDGFVKPFCGLRTQLAMIESVEAHVRFSWSLFRHSFHNFDGNMTTHPVLSTIQRTYDEAYMNESLSNTLRPWKDLVKGASFIASSCHTNYVGFRRNNYVISLRDAGFRVDGLGGCLSTENNMDPYGVPIVIEKRPRDIGLLHNSKMDPQSRYMFHLAFENTIEDGYVTEKLFDALYAGTVPVYLGDAKTARHLLPDPMAAIFVEDYPDMAALARYLISLTEDEAAYERHRVWRQTFNRSIHIATRPQLQKSYQCQVCEWAMHAYKTIAMPDRAMSKKKCLPVEATREQRKQGWS
jgi:hypothetical protein